MNFAHPGASYLYQPKFRPKLEWQKKIKVAKFVFLKVSKIFLVRKKGRNQGQAKYNTLNASGCKCADPPKYPADLKMNLGEKQD